MFGLKKLFVPLSVAACTAALAVPQVASAGAVDDFIGNVEKTVSEVGNLLGGKPQAQPAPAPAPSGAAPAPAAEGGTTTPGISGTNPHGQGEVLDVTVPLLEEIGGGEIIVGQSRGEQDESSGDYRGQIIIASALGIDVGFVDTEEGESETTPTQALNDALDSLCMASSVCLQVLDFNSTTTGNGSFNRFSAAEADVGDGFVTTGLIRSEGNISDNGSCQTAQGSSSAVDVGAIGGAVSVAALTSESESRACRNGTESAEADSQVVAFNDGEIFEPVGCTDAVDAEFDLLGLITGVCNGDDTNGAQADSPYNVRKALGLELIPQIGILLIDGATSESLAVAPEGEPPVCPDPNNPVCDPDPRCPDPDNPACDRNPPDRERDPEGPAGPGGPSADGPDDDQLPFTGADLGVLALIGLGIMAGGLALMAMADRRRARSTA